jgi:hypothetical protein
MSGFSMTGNCDTEGIISGHFAVQNQLNPFAPCFGFHRDECGGAKVSDFATSIFRSPRAW